MKIQELLTESIRLREFVESADLIDMLTQAVENTETTDPVHKQAMQLVDQLLAAVKQPTPAKPAAAPAPVQQAPVQQAPTPSPFEKPGVATPVAEARALSGVEKIKLDAIKKLQNDPRLEQLLSDPANARLIISLHEKSIEQGKDIQHHLYLEWNDALEEQANKLASKVYNNASVIHGAIETNIARDNAGSALDLSEAKGKKKEETGEVIKNKIVDILKTMFDRPVKTERDRVAVEAMKQSIKEFMTKCQTGIIDFHRVLANKDPNAKIDDFVQGTDQKIYYIIRNEAFEAKPGVTGGAWGPGEIGLALLSNPVTKGSSGGDLRVQTEAGLIEIELKGMKEAKSGGRFNSDKGIVKASQAARAFKAVAYQLVNDLTQIINNGKPTTDVQGVATKLFTYVSNQKTGKTKIKAIETFDFEAINKVWNPQLIIPASQIDPTATKQAVKEFLKDMMDLVVLSSGKKYAEPHVRAFLKDPAVFEKVAGTRGAFQLNWLTVQAGICRILYAVYSGLDDKGVIMYFNTTTSNYYVVKGPEDVQEKILAGLLKTGNAILDFKAGQVPASPQVGIA
jgi:hypothetical protein